MDIAALPLLEVCPAEGFLGLWSRWYENLFYTVVTAFFVELGKPPIRPMPPLEFIC